MSDTQKYTRPNVPNLRFPGFEGEWKQYTMGEITELFSRRNKNRTDYPMFSVTNARGFVNQQEQFEDREMKGEDIAAYKIVSPGEFAYNPARINVGSIARYDGETDCMISSLYVCFKAKKELVNSQLLLHILKSPKMMYNYGINGEGGVRIYLFYPNFARIRVKLPSLEEQRRIASFLDCIEERIQTQNKVIEKLKSLIRELNNKLMDNPLWNKVYLGDFMQFYSTNSLSWEQLSYESGRMNNLHYGLIHIGLPTMTDCKDNTLPYIQAPFIPKQFTICKDGDIAFADASEDTEEVGKAIELYNTGSMDVVCGLHTIHGRDIMGLTVVGFKGFAFNSKYFHDQLRRLAQGSKVYSITAENIKNCYIYVPEVTEQRRIVGLLLCLQDKIKCAERELNSYEMQKQFMLSEMLV